jgi:uncharacterized protein (TIGR04255 family)
MWLASFRLPSPAGACAEPFHHAIPARVPGEGIVVAVYKRPPILEAVIDFRSRANAPYTTVDKLRVRLKREFPNSTEAKHYNVNLDADAGKANVTTDYLGFQISSQDGVEIRLISTAGLTCSRLAPYNGWKEFSDGARKTWDEWINVETRNRNTSRLGIRYINRIDISSSSIVQQGLGEYFNISPRHEGTPEDSLSGFSVQLQSSVGIKADDCKLIVNFGRMPSPLIAYDSFLLDIDVYRDTAPPTDPDTLWHLVDRMRDYKNSAFEAAITDRTRLLFE